MTELPLTYCLRRPPSSVHNYLNALPRSRKKGALFLKAKKKRVSQNRQVGVGKGVMLSPPASLTDSD
jgi:hypothetical protein